MDRIFSHGFLSTGGAGQNRLHATVAQLFQLSPAEPAKKAVVSYRMKKIRLLQPLPFVFRTGDDDMGVSMFSLRDPASNAIACVLAAGYQENQGPLRTAVFGRLVDLSGHYKSIREFLEAMAAGYVLSDDFFCRPTVRHVLNTLADKGLIEITNL